MKTNDVNKILIVSLCNDFSKEVGNVLSQTLGMMFCDIDDLFEYELIDKDKIQQISSKEYMRERERKVMRHFASFENVVGVVGFEEFVNNTNVLQQRTLVVFVNLPKSYVEERGKAIDVIAYQDRNREIEAKVDAVVSVRKVDTKFVCEKILDVLRKTL